jgi:hypothetical protein
VAQLASGSASPGRADWYKPRLTDRRSPTAAPVRVHPSPEVMGASAVGAYDVALDVVTPRFARNVGDDLAGKCGAIVGIGGHFTDGTNAFGRSSLELFGKWADAGR